MVGHKYSLFCSLVFGYSLDGKVVWHHQYDSDLDGCPLWIVKLNPFYCVELYLVTVAAKNKSGFFYGYGFWGGLVAHNECVMLCGS